MTVSTVTLTPGTTTAPGVGVVAGPVRRRPRLLDLFCGAGGASAGYYAAGFDVVGVDIAEQPDYPFPFLRADALTVNLHGVDVVHASPPCQAYSSATPEDRRASHPDLVAAVRSRLVQAAGSPGGPGVWVIENVPGAPLRNPITLCGDSLRLGVRRHRLFESNVPLVGTPCWHDRPAAPVRVYGDRPEPGVRVETARDAMGIGWMPWPALTQAIPPAYTYWIGVQILTRLAGDESASNSTGIRLVDSDSSRGCRRCGGALPPRPATGRWPRYCSNACRQAAYRARRRGGAA